MGNHPLNGNYIAGFVQADGSFSCTVTRKIRGDKSYLGLKVTFTLVQKIEYKDLILEIQKMWGGIGFWYYSDKDKTIRYQVNKISDLHNVVIPFFLKYHLRSGKLQSFLYFKYIVEVMFKKEHRNNHKVLLSLIVIASHLNPLGKIGNNIRYLNKEEQKLVLNNIQPEGVDISILNSAMKNFKFNPLNIHFLNGLIDGDGSLSVYFVKSEKSYVSPRFNFTIVQDVHNLSLLEEVKAFLGFGEIYTPDTKYSLFKTSNVKHISLLIFNIMGLKELNMEAKGSQKDFFAPQGECGKDFSLPLPIIKRNKFIHFAFILVLLQDKDLSYREKLQLIFRHSYYVSENWATKSIEEYLKDLEKKFNI